jgi:hypothetical protein
MTRTRKVFYLTGIFLLLLLTLISCVPKPAESASTPPSVTDLPANETITPPATPTATPQPGKVILIASDLSTAQAQSAQALLTELASGSGLTLETKTSLQVNEITPEWRIVVLLNMDDNLAMALAAAPQVQFVVLSPYDIVLTNNLSVIRIQPESQAFLAGYLAILIASDWRAGALLPSNEPDGSVLEAAFINGGQYFCGICNPYYAPLVRFPISARLPANSDAATWAAAVEQLHAYLVYVIYVDPLVSLPDLLLSLAQQGYILIGGQTPPDELRPIWAATITQDLASPLRDLWENLLAGQGGLTVTASIQITDINPDLFSQGKQRLVNELIEKMDAGLVYPGEVPLQ